MQIQLPYDHILGDKQYIYNTIDSGLGLRCLTPLSTIFQLYRDG